MSALENYPRISPFLWFDSNAGDAVDFYISIFKNSSRTEELRVSDPQVGPDGKVMTISFTLDGVKFAAINGGPYFKFTEAISLVVRCDTQEEIDYYYDKLVEGGTESQCGWLKDKFGLSWQVVPAKITELVGNPKGMKAMMGMKKLNIAEMERAAAS